ncbi:WAP-type 'four-disulfide core, partial [Dictyocaulus viviparus]
ALHLGSTPSVKKLGICPTAVLNPGCREECRSDEDCVALAKCCKATCGTKCMDPAITSPCMHRLIAFVRQHPLLSPPVQCDLNGDFRQIQCDNSIKQCWCVNRYGIEEIGTRTNNEQGVMPRCRHPKMCPVSCAQLNCSYGILVDSNGCPRNDVCQCKNPCQVLITFRYCPYQKKESLTDYFKRTVS